LTDHVVYTDVPPGLIIARKDLWSLNLFNKFLEEKNNVKKEQVKHLGKDVSSIVDGYSELIS
jgi:hypothetical protein